jgi:hypothetical protein
MAAASLGHQTEWGLRFNKKGHGDRRPPPVRISELEEAIFTQATSYLKHSPPTPAQTKC